MVVYVRVCYFLLGTSDILARFLLFLIVLFLHDNDDMHTYNEEDLPAVFLSLSLFLLRTSDNIIHIYTDKKNIKNKIQNQKKTFSFFFVLSLPSVLLPFIWIPLLFYLSYLIYFIVW